MATIKKPEPVTLCTKWKLNIATNVYLQQAKKPINKTAIKVKSPASNGRPSISMPIIKG
jgi:hypothetical protein